MVTEITGIIYILFRVLECLLFASVILSWLPINPGDALYDIAVVVYELTEPMCLPFRKIIPPIGGLDFSIIFVFIALQMFENFIFSMLGGR